MQQMMGVSSGMELLTLPHGHQLRLDLLERYCMEWHSSHGTSPAWHGGSSAPNVVEEPWSIPVPPALTPLCVSPHGRFHTMSIMIAVDILGCTGSTEERAALLHKTIQLAAELKSTMGNMFSFAAVMNALEMTQVQECSFHPLSLGSAYNTILLPTSCRL